MGKRSRRKHQGDPNELETDTSDEETAKKCTHLAKGLNLPQLRKVTGQGKNPHECEECSKLPEKTAENDDTNATAAGVSASAIEVAVTQTENSEIKEEEEGAWICLQCGHRGCGRNKEQHALAHYKTPRSTPHDLVVDSLTWLTWCYKCDDFVTVESARLTEAIEFIRKHYGVSGKIVKGPPSMKRSQSQPDAKEAIPNKEQSSEKSDPITMTKDFKTRATGNDSLPPVKGLANLGNTCFFNSVMQVLSQTHWLTQLLDMEIRDGLVVQLKGSETVQSCTSSCSTLSELDNCDSGVGSLLEGENAEDSIVAEPIEIKLGAGKPLTLTLASFLKEMHSPSTTFGTGKRRQSSATVTPSSLFNQICRKSPQFKGFQQQDAHELLRHLLDGVRVEEVTRWRHAIMARFHVPVTVAKNQTTDIDPQLRRKLKVYGKETAHTFIDKLFGGQLISTVICETCRHPYQVLEPFMDLSLPVSEDKSPPVCKRRTSVVESIPCLAPQTPEALSKHQQKKLRKTARKGKKPVHMTKLEMEAAQSQSTEDHESVEQNAIEDSKAEDSKAEDSKAEDSKAEDSKAEDSKAEDSKAEDSKSEDSKAEDSKSEDSKVGDSNIKVFVDERSYSHEDKESDVEESSSSISTEGEKEGERGDIEDNDDVAELTNKLDEMQVNQGNQAEDDSVSQHKTENPSNPAIRRIRSEWVARSLCTLAPRYHSSNQECSVQSCLNLFTAPELLTGANKYGCENCTKKKAVVAEAEGALEGSKTPTVYSAASKQLLIFAPPAILTLHLKRFTQTGFALRKAQKHVDFPVRLDLAPFCSATAAGITTVASDQKEIVYSLYGVIEHSGKLSSGHYTAFVKVRSAGPPEAVTNFLQRLPMQTDDLTRLKDQLSNRLLSDKAHSDGVQSATASEGSWYYCSDAHVMPVTEEKVLRAQAFLLFYERIF